MTNKSAFALKGDILYSGGDKLLREFPGHVLVCEEGRVAGVFPQLPEKYAGIALEDYSGKLILPGLVDLHLHAPQYAFRGLGMDLELLDWLNTHTFPEEAKYSNMEYARCAYRMFADALVQGGTTRAVLFATLHADATLLLMDMLEQSGLVTLVGKVNMDRNGPATLQEAGAEASLATTSQWLAAVARKNYVRTAPILTPRFVPSCSQALLEGLGKLQDETGLPLQSHLSENPAEVAWVKELCPESASYADAYRMAGALGGPGKPTIMAHCVYVDEAEQQLLQEGGVYVAHCPTSNTDLASGVAPVRRFLQNGINTGLGTDMAGGHSLSMFRAAADAVACSKLRWRMQESQLSALTVPEVFYLATRGGGGFFGKVGAFEEGYAFDAIVVDETAHPCPFALTLPERLERTLYLSHDSDIAAKYVEGRRVK